MKSINIIAMAGIGKRFKEKNFLQPKPLIEIKKKPMFYYAAKSLPKSNQYIFISNIKLKNYLSFKHIIKKHFKNNKIIYVKKKTSGQACTCNLATNYLKNDTNVVYSSCDYEYKFNKKKYYELINNCDVVVFAHKPNKKNIINYKSYGWIKKGKKNFITKIECKNKVSNKLNNDLVIVGSFAFKNKKIFINSYKQMITQKHKVNNEYYMDTLIKYSIKLNYKIKYQLVKNFNSFGTPEEITDDK